MKSFTKKSFMAGAVLCIIALAANTSYGYEDEPARFGRVSEIDGSMQLLRYNAPEWEYCAINMLIQEGDQVSTGNNDFAEIQFDNGSSICLGEHTDIQIAQLSKDYVGYEETTTINIETGHLYVRIPRYRQADIRLEVATPTCSILMEDESRVRIKVKGNGTTYIFVYEGYADVESAGGALYLRSGEKVLIDSDGFPSSIKRLSYRDKDTFYRRCARLDRRYARRSKSRGYCSPDIYIGVVDLDYYGHWRHVPTYGYVWVPRVYSGWRPYYHGHWAWTACGWTWVSYEPWGWVPYHYGRWTYVVGCGWAWIPGSAWGPGWVVWTDGPGWIAWAPLGPHNVPCDCIYVRNRPVYVWTSVYYDSFVKYRYKSAGHLTGKKYRTPSYKYYRKAKVDKDAWTKSPPKAKPLRYEKAEKSTVTLKDKYSRKYVKPDPVNTKPKARDKIETKKDVRISTKREKHEDKFKDIYKRKSIRKTDHIRSSKDSKGSKATDRDYFEKDRGSKTDTGSEKTTRERSATKSKDQKVDSYKERDKIKSDRSTKTPRKDSKATVSQSRSDKTHREKSTTSKNTYERKSYIRKRPRNQ